MSAVMEYKPAQEQGEEAVPAAGGNTDIIGMLWRRKWLLLFGAVAGLVAGFLLYTQKRPVYESNAKIFITNRGSSTGDKGLATSQREFIVDFMAGQEALIKSYEIQTRAAVRSNSSTRLSNPKVICDTLAGNPSASENFRLTCRLIFE